MEPKTFPLGGIWDEDEWKIVFDHESRPHSWQKPCQHTKVVTQPITTITAPPNVQVIRREERTVWITPRVVVATNEGGHATTGVCLDCILAAVAALER